MDRPAEFLLGQLIAIAVDLFIKIIAAKSISARFEGQSMFWLAIVQSKQRQVERPGSQVVNQDISANFQTMSSVGQCRGDRFIKQLDRLKFRVLGRLD